jgi:hypothetical protein
MRKWSRNLDGNDPMMSARQNISFAFLRRKLQFVIFVGRNNVPIPMGRQAAHYVSLYGFVRAKPEHSMTIVLPTPISYLHALKITRFLDYPVRLLSGLETA